LDLIRFHFPKKAISQLYLSRSLMSDW
jgi:hypothetical protein